MSGKAKCHEQKKNWLFIHNIISKWINYYREEREEVKREADWYLRNFQVFSICRERERESKRMHERMHRMIAK